MILDTTRARQLADAARTLSPSRPAAEAPVRRPRAAVLDVASAWTGELRPDDAAPVVTFTLRRDATADDRWLAFASCGVADVTVRLLEATGDTFVALVGPYHDPRAGRVHLLLEGRLDAGRMWGSYRTVGIHGRPGATGAFGATAG